MRLLSLFIGLWLVTIGIVTMVSDDISDDIWWFAASGFVAAGVAGLVAAVRPTSRRSSPS